MGSYHEFTRTVTIAGASTTERVWGTPWGDPIKNLYIYLSTAGMIPVTGDVDYEIFWGGQWEGDPFGEIGVTTHSGGISQGASAAITGAIELAHLVYSTTNSLPSNRVLRFPQSDGSVEHKNIGGLPVVIDITNDKASALTLYVTFVSESVAERV